MVLLVNCFLFLTIFNIARLGVVYKSIWRNAECVVKQVKMEVSHRDEFLKEAIHMTTLRPHPNVGNEKKKLEICS